MTQTEIGIWLAARRRAAGLTQMEAAASIGKDSGLISKWERGTLRMAAESFLELVVLYKAEDQLVGWLQSMRRRADTSRLGKGAAKVAMSDGGAAAKRPA